MGWGWGGGGQYHSGAEARPSEGELTSRCERHAGHDLRGGAVAGGSALAPTAAGPAEAAPGPPTPLARTVRALGLSGGLHARTGRGPLIVRRAQGRTGMRDAYTGAAMTDPAKIAESTAAKTGSAACRAAGRRVTRARPGGTRGGGAARQDYVRDPCHVRRVSFESRGVALTTCTKDTAPRPMERTVTRWPNPLKSEIFLRASRFAGEGLGTARIPASH